MGSLHPLAVFIALTASGCQILFQLEPVAAEGAAYAHRKQITLTTSATLTDFPAAIAISDDADLRDGVIDGQDFLFTAADGETELSHELECYDRTRGSMLAWVRVPAIVGNTDIYLYYAGPSRASDTKTWRSEYGAVWHFAEPDDQFYDATSNENTLIATTPAAEPTRGTKHCASLSFDGATQWLEAKDADSLNAGDGSFTYSVWVDVDTPSGEFDMPLYKGGGGPTNRGYDFELGTGAWWAGVSDGTNDEYAMFDTTADLLGRWIQLTSVIDRASNELRVYANGVERGSMTLPTGSLGSPGRVFSVSRPQGQMWFRGGLDEIRLYHGVLDDTWILNEYRNLAYPESFLTIGLEEDL